MCVFFLGGHEQPANLIMAGSKSIENAGCQRAAEPSIAILSCGRADWVARSRQAWLLGSVRLYGYHMRTS